MPLKGTDSKAPVCQVGAGETALSRTAMRHAIRAHYGHWYLWIWGLIWLAMALLGHFLGPSATPFFNGLCLIGITSSILIGFVQGGQIRAPLDRRFLQPLALLSCLVILCGLLFLAHLIAPTPSSGSSGTLPLCPCRPTSWPEFGSIVTYFGSVF